jgi:ABC-type multidrug transport system fused ATPase/permease subunit
MALPFKLIPARHRLGLMNPDLERRLLEARQVFARDLPDALRGCVEFFVEDAYNAASTIQDNILFGKVAYGQAQVGGKVGRLMAQVIDELGLRETIQEIGLDHYVGVAGSRLSRAQRQKVALARGILKNPDLLVINEVTAGLDGASQSQIHNAILEERQGQGVVWVLHRPSIARRFDQTLVLRAGQLAEHGSYQDLDKPGTVMHELLAAE